MRKRNGIATTGFWMMLVAIVFGIATNGGLNTIVNFIHVPSMIVTFGGALFAVMATADSLEDFLGKGIRLVVDGTDPELVRDILENELLHKEKIKSIMDLEEREAA